MKDKDKGALWGESAMTDKDDKMVPENENQPFGDEDSGEDEMGLGALKMGVDEGEEDGEEDKPWVNQLDQDEAPADSLRDLNYGEDQGSAPERLPKGPDSDAAEQQAVEPDEDGSLDPADMPSAAAAAAEPDPDLEPDLEPETEPEPETPETDAADNEAVSPFPSIGQAEPPAKRRSFDAAYDEAAGERAKEPEEPSSGEPEKGEPPAAQSDSADAFGGDDGVGAAVPDAGGSNVTPFPVASEPGAAAPLADTPADPPADPKEEIDEYDDDTYDAPESIASRLPFAGQVSGLRDLAGGLLGRRGRDIGLGILGLGVIGLAVWLVVDSFPGANEPTAQDRLAGRFAVPVRSTPAPQPASEPVTANLLDAPLGDRLFAMPGDQKPADGQGPESFVVSARTDRPGGSPAGGAALPAPALAPAPARAAVDLPRQPNRDLGGQPLVGVDAAAMEGMLASAMSTAMAEAANGNRAGAGSMAVEEIQALRTEIRTLTGRIAELEVKTRRAAQAQATQQETTARDRRSLAGTVGMSRGQRGVCSADNQLFLSALGQPLQAGVYGNAAGRRWVRMVSPVWQHSLRPGDALPSGGRNAEVQLDDLGVYVLVHTDEGECVIPIGGTAG